VLPLSLLTLAAAVVLAACGTGHGTLPGQPGGRSGGYATGGYNLVPAQYPDCARQGTALATYLDTGEPTSDDPSFGDQRQQVLALTGDSRALFIRQTADAYIDQCDQQEYRSDASASAAASDASASASASAAAASASAAADVVANKARPLCAAIGGTFEDYNDQITCAHVGYIGSDGSSIYYSAVEFDDSGALIGPMDTSGIGATETECARGYYPDLSTGPGYATPGHWNVTLQACLGPGGRS
jgi:hypothetical protein